MDIEFRDSELERLAYEAAYTGKWSAILVKAYRKRVNLIQQATNRRDLYAFKSLRLEKLKGKRRHQHSVRLNDQYRLIIEFRAVKGNEGVTLIDIEDYH